MSTQFDPPPEGHQLPQNPRISVMQQQAGALLDSWVSSRARAHFDKLWLEACKTDPPSATEEECQQTGVDRAMADYRALQDCSEYMRAMMQSGRLASDQNARKRRWVLLLGTLIGAAAGVDAALRIWAWFH